MREIPQVYDTATDLLDRVEPIFELGRSEFGRVSSRIKHLNDLFAPQ